MSRVTIRPDDVRGPEGHAPDGEACWSGSGAPGCTGGVGSGVSPSRGDAGTTPARRSQGDGGEVTGHERVDEAGSAASEAPPGAEAQPNQPEGMDEPWLTVAAVASRLGIAPATLRTWDRRYGLGPTNHTSGSHRRYGPQDVAKLEQMQRALLRGASPAEAARYAHSVAEAAPQGVAPVGREGGAEEATGMVSGVLSAPEVVEPPSTVNTGGRGLRLGDASPRARGLGRAVLALDGWSVQRMLIEAVEADGVVTAWNEVLQPVLHATQQRYQRFGSGVEAVQLLMECAATALRSVIATASVDGSGPPLNSRPVMLASVPGEDQELELVACAAALARHRVGHLLFGSALPKEGLDAAVRRCAPVAVVLWSRQPHHASPRVLGEMPVTRQRARLLAGGTGWDAVGLPTHAEHVRSLRAAVDRVSDIVSASL